LEEIQQGGYGVPQYVAKLMLPPLLLNPGSRLVAFLGGSSPHLKPLLKRVVARVGDTIALRI
jgi:hypothetical protein